MSIVGIIIQARLGSTRLPGKVLRTIDGSPILRHILVGLGELRHEVDVIVATSNETRDDPIFEYCHSHGYKCFRGNEMDVLARYYECAIKYNFFNIVRLTADNPFTDIVELDRLIELHIKTNNDYTHSFGELPIGVGAEIFTMSALERSYREGTAPNHREHVNEYIQENPERFNVGKLNVPAEKHAPKLRLTVDTEEDFTRARNIIENNMKGSRITTAEAIEFCSLYV